MTPSLSPDELLSTTRAVRRRLDFNRPLDLALVYECLQMAIQAPSGGNSQNWHFVLVTKPEMKEKIGEIYRKGWAIYSSSFRDQIPPEDKPRSEQNSFERISGSADYLARNIHRAPVLLIPCFSGRVDRATETPVLLQASAYGSLLPAVWSFMLAARARGLGTCFTTLHLMHEEEAARVLSIPFDCVTQVALIPVAHTLGDAFRPAARNPLDNVVHIDGW